MVGSLLQKNIPYLWLGYQTFVDWETSTEYVFHIIVSQPLEPEPA